MVKSFTAKVPDHSEQTGKELTSMTLPLEVFQNECHSFWPNDNFRQISFESKNACKFEN
jgi:hypothetical protein